ncbi:MAG TPA: flagellar basal body rod protein FlgB [Caulobacteraceae bacterium]|nr:flagellar basal body rod protein FlgB [Caulobacteraceae bacterium]
MNLGGVPIFAMLKSRLDYLSARQRLIAENVANSDTPGYAPKDLKPFTVTGPGLALAGVAATLTSPMHLAAPATAALSGDRAIVSPDSETTLNGNSVVLEDEMMKMTQARTDYDAAVGFYQQALNMIQTAIRRPGG